jgi:hypothetical protein
MPDWILLHGRDEPPPRRVHLRAGPLDLTFEEGTLRWIRLGEREILRQVYMALRPPDWSTVVPVFSNLRIDDRGDSFEVTFAASHRQGAIDFSWQGRITGDVRGTIRFVMDGTAHRTFTRARIGFCVLHPMECAGRPVELARADGTREQGRFPEAIAPWQPFRGLAGMTHEVLASVRAEVRFEGETFETEDHRNWTDANFKTYCTPLSIPHRFVEVRAGEEIVQSVTLRLHGQVPTVSTGAQPLVVTVGESPVGSLPRLGLGMASHGHPLTAREERRLRALKLAHLRLDLHLRASDVERRVARARDAAAALGAQIEVALFLTAGADRELERLTDVMRRLRPPVDAWLVFHEEELSTSEKWVRLAAPVLRALAPAARLGTGTNAYFTELNRERPPLDGVELVAYSLNPQVHAFDDASLMENLQGQRATIESARRFVGATPLAVTPVTLRPRLQPNGAPPEPAPVPGRLPSQVDPRQMSLFGAAWTLGSLKYLAEGGLHSATYYETTGWRGVMEGEPGPPLPDAFPSQPGAVFPLYHVLADAGECAGGDVMPARCSDPRRVEALALRADGRARILVANLTPEPQAVTVTGVPPRVRVRHLDERTAPQAIREPEAFRRESGKEVDARAGRLELELGPFAVTRIEQERSD